MPRKQKIFTRDTKGKDYSRDSRRIATGHRITTSKIQGKRKKEMGEMPSRQPWGQEKLKKKKTKTRRPRNFPHEGEKD